MIVLILIFIMIITLRVLSIGKDYDETLEKEIRFK